MPSIGECMQGNQTETHPELEQNDRVRLTQTGYGAIQGRVIDASEVADGRIEIQVEDQYERVRLNWNADAERYEGAMMTPGMGRSPTADEPLTHTDAFVQDGELAHVFQMTVFPRSLRRAADDLVEMDAINQGLTFSNHAGEVNENRPPSLITHIEMDGLLSVDKYLNQNDLVYRSVHAEREGDVYDRDALMVTIVEWPSE